MSQVYEQAATDDDADALPAVTKNVNPFGAPQDHGAAVAVEKQRANAETQAAMIIAQQYPRSPVVSMDRILQAFMRPGLAEKAQYQYARGGSDIAGPSIRAAEAIAQAWGNMQFGVRELEQRRGESTVEAFAWDIETNTRATKLFQVRHWRDTKRGGYALEDSRDIYELIANNGARRMRACILSLIPGDVVEEAMKQAETTLRTKVQITPERLAGVVDKFAEHGVTKQQIELRIQRRLESITPALMVALGRILNSLADGMSAPADWFELPRADAGQPASRAAHVQDLLRDKGATAAATPAAPVDAAAEPAPAATPAGEPSPEEQIEIAVQTFLEGTLDLDQPKWAAEVGKLAATRGVTDQDAVREVARKATGKPLLLKANAEKIVRAIYAMPAIAEGAGE